MVPPTTYLRQWGQFSDHDIGLTGGTDPAEPAGIEVPCNDGHFFPGARIDFNRSVYDTGERAGPNRQKPVSRNDSRNTN